MEEDTEARDERKQSFLLPLLLLSLVLAPLMLEIPIFVHLDHELFLQINSYYTPSDWDIIFLSITQLGSLEFLIILDIILFAAGKRKFGTYLLILLISYSIVGYGMKIIVDRPRPYLEYSDIFYLGLNFEGSFPSGHSLGAAAFTALLYVRKNPYLGLYLPLAILVFFSRIFLGMHYPLDVFAGIWIGIIIGIWVGNLKLEHIHDGPPILKKDFLRYHRKFLKT